MNVSSIIDIYDGQLNDQGIEPRNPGPLVIIKCPTFKTSLLLQFAFLSWEKEPQRNQAENSNNPMKIDQHSFLPPVGNPFFI